MKERDFWPEGVERCSLGKFALWLAFLGVFLAWGGYAVFRILITDGLGVTGLNNYFGFGLWITFDLAVIALGAGAFFTGFLKYILGIEQLKYITNYAVIIGFLCYSGAMGVLGLDVGQPGRAWFGYWHPNVHSMLTEVMFCITCYCTVLMIEYLPVVLENRQISKIPFLKYMAHNLHIFMPLFAGIGTFLSFFHQGSLGGMYGVLFARPFLFREGFFIWPWTFFLFVASAIACGPLFTMLCTTVAEKLTGRRLLDFSTKQLLAKISGLLLTFYIFFKIIDTYAWATGILPKMGFTFNQMFNGAAGYSVWLLWIEILVCGVLPAFILLVPGCRNKSWMIHFAAVLACIGLSLNRFVMTVQALAIPVLSFDKWETYIPNWAEWAPTLMVIAYMVLVISLSYRYLNIFPKERALN